MPVPSPRKAPSLRPVPAVKRAVAILFHLENAGHPQSLSQVARAVDIIPSSCLHILRELIGAGLVSTDTEAKTYALGPAVLRLANHYTQQNRFIDVARAHMEPVARDFGVDVSAHEADSLGHLVVVAATQASLDVAVRVPLGHRFPLMAGASGRCFAAWNPWPEPALKAQFEKVRWQMPLTFSRWREQVAQTHRNGIGVDDGHYRKGITTLAAPVFPPEGPLTRVIGALCISEQLTPTRRRQLAQALKQAAQQISADLRGMPR